MTATDGTSKTEATYYTISDHRFFLGTVALLNSLRVTGTRESSSFSMPA